MKILLIADASPLADSFEWAARGAFHTVRRCERRHLARDHRGYEDVEAIVDLSASNDRDVVEVARCLGKETRYLLLSSGSVYADSHVIGLTEDAEVRRSTVDCRQDLVAAEQAATRLFGKDRTLILRPGWIVGPDDAEHRLVSWVQRLRRGGDVLAPGPRNQRIQWVDARDLADWSLACLTKNRSGTFNVCGPREPATLEGFLREIRTFCGSDANLVWVDESFLEAEGIRPEHLPFWAPEDSQRGHVLLDSSLAFSNGFEPRRLLDSLQDLDASGISDSLGLDAEREDRALRNWAKRSERRACTLVADRQI